MDAIMSFLEPIIETVKGFIGGGAGDAAGSFDFASILETIKGFIAGLM